MRLPCTAISSIDEIYLNMLDFPLNILSLCRKNDDDYRNKISEKAAEIPSRKSF